MSALADRWEVDPEALSSAALEAPRCQCGDRAILDEFGDCSVCGREILMGLHSSLGPIDPQLGGLPAHGVMEEFKTAAEEIKADPAKIPVWQPIIGKYHPTLIGECQKAIQWSTDMVREWLITGMFDGATKPGPTARANKVLKELGDHALTLSHRSAHRLRKGEGDRPERHGPGGRRRFTGRDPDGASPLHADARRHGNDEADRESVRGHVRPSRRAATGTGCAGLGRDFCVSCTLRAPSH